jgi:hypothetical protein
MKQLDKFVQTIHTTFMPIIADPTGARREFTAGVAA